MVNFLDWRDDYVWFKLGVIVEGGKDYALSHSSDYGYPFILIVVLENLAVRSYIKVAACDDPFFPFLSFFSRSNCLSNHKSSFNVVAHRTFDIF